VLRTPRDSLNPKVEDIRKDLRGYADRVRRGGSSRLQLEVPVEVDHRFHRSQCSRNLFVFIVQ